MSLQECMAKTTSREFNDWMVYFELDDSRTHRQDYYLASIATEVRRSYVKNPKSVKLDDMMLKFNRKQTKQVSQEQLDMAKAVWRARLGIKKEDHE